MSGCRHRVVSRYVYDRVQARTIECPWCCECKTYIGLGPSRDDSPEVALEMRAAELASAQISYAMPLWMQGFATDEAHGWRDFTDDYKGGDCQCRDRPGLTARNWHSGYLARAIVNHTDDQGGE